MDLDAVLARAPEVAVVDELAHTNVPGSRNAKRWQDVDELLDAGIDVLSTVNVQHLESLNDVVERITGVTQQETVPDEVVRRAEQLELVDITPEALRRRLAHGNVYPAERIDAALGNYFRPGNLTALRELALLWVADQVDVALQRYRAEQRITDTWEARERVVVAITGGPESETLIRRGQPHRHPRPAPSCMVVHILRGDGLSGRRAGRDRPAAASSPRSVGATFHTVVGDDVPTALLDFARGANATQLVIGTSRRSRLARVFDEGIGAAGRAAVRARSTCTWSPTTEAGRAGCGPGSREPAGAVAAGRGLAAGVVLPALATVFGVALRGRARLRHRRHRLLPRPPWSSRWSAGSGLRCVAAVRRRRAAELLLHRRRCTRSPCTAPQNLVTLIAMVVVAVLVALVVDQAARRATQAARARTEAALLASYARTVLTAPNPIERLLEKVARELRG